ncbi:MAG: Helix-turn-helix domain protein [Parcubacteria group bacterium GW2011_GWA2_51_12]|nr:MAG: Helix-turn-helix domain protein [Parcubacteria group bacterium GW2011_GWA2_51_12]
MKNYKNFKARLLKDKVIKKAYDELGPEFALVEMIIQKRLKQGLTQKQLAKKAGTRQPVISRLERGTYNPTVKFLHRIADALGVELRVSFS